jgi:group I intron endonuclease
VITYAAINLTNKKFYVGSTVNFEESVKKHHSSKADYPFQNSLRKDPENFYWVVSEDDGTDTREEEQYYLDFYHGTLWCYNLNDVASCPPNLTGRTGEWTEESKAKRRGEGNPAFGKDPWNKGLPPEENPLTGRTWSGDREAARSLQTGMKGWNNGVKNTYAKECPGEGWVLGWLPRSKK